ncbi:aldo/keto reductase [Sphingobacterium sp. SGG-5]|uniref:aldo/keto reductase n=1 Tax=Sphingobacterium sp. SGG-5 TaxID=2710881 RepID=UPI0013EC7746|nr:aldo/keto reductase [Sphingobacterium sp. SGG-5]NGM62841.1 aldo/keto reductase [Sphingobacterium sp. SGG-5]
MIQEVRSLVTPLTLGTVQLGMAYGIANQKGKPDMETGHKILKSAAELGVTTWDTSRHYGVSEEVIGNFLKNNTSYSPYVISKFKWSDRALENEKLAKQEALAQVRTSLQALGQDQLPILLYHTDKDQDIRRVISILPGVCRLLREEGLIKAGGISLYYPKDVAAILEEPEIAAVQLPINVFDQRLVANKAMDELADVGKLVFARSVFLQGLFFLTEDKLPSSLKGVAYYIDELKKLADRAEMTVAQFAFSYVRDIRGVSSIVFGADNVEQVKQNVQLWNGKSIPDEIRENAHKIFGNIDERIITPGLWKS